MKDLCKCGHPNSEHGSDFCMGDMTLCDCEEFTSKNPTTAAAVEPELEDEEVQV